MLQVQAHGGGLLKVKDTWYWYGESYKRPLLNDFLSEGVNLYSSSGEDQPCTCLLASHASQLMRKAAPSPFTPTARLPWQSVKARVCVELKDGIALPLRPAFSSTKHAAWCLSMPTICHHRYIYRQCGCPSL